MVIEIEERAISFDDSAYLRQAVQNYRRRGYRLAPDNFGFENSSLEKVWSLEPDIVNLDRRFPWHTRQNTRVRKILPKLVALLHGLNSEVLIQGVEENVLFLYLLRVIIYSMPRGHLKEKFPNLVSYQRFVALFALVLIPLCLYLEEKRSVPELSPQIFIQMGHRCIGLERLHGGYQWRRLYRLGVNSPAGHRCL